MRDGTPYADGRAWIAPTGYGVSAQAPAAGFYRMRMRANSHYVGIRIWFGQPHDPLTGDVMDRSLRWQADANGRYIELDRVWPACATDPIDQSEYEHLKGLQDWASDHAPQSALADPRRALNLLTAPLVF